CFTDIEMKELKKRNPGEAFEVMRSLSTPDAKVDFPLSLLERKETPMVDIKKKLEAVEKRRKSCDAAVLNHLAGKREHGKEVVQKAIEGNCNFNKMMREKMNQQVEAYHENCNAWLAALLEKSNEKNKTLDE
ncbi:stathmin-like, partial [Pleuronectes platessa]|uniref:stathmin-like n=1 Tax=Pleuronectes platessa TaxID=8262 RepID=UPI00232A3A90